jgi:PleD family two-component response regulator
VNTTAAEALALADRIQSTVRRSSAASAAQRTKEPPAPRHTVSIGAADLDCVAVPSFDALHAAADHALYAAKTAGRDRTVAAAHLPGKSIPTLTSLTY